MLFAGFGAVWLNFLFQNVSYFGKDIDEESVHPIGKYFTQASLILINPLQILITRLQWMDYPMRHRMLRTMIDMVVKDRFQMFYRGLVPTLNGQIFLYITITWATKLVFEYRFEFMNYMWPLLVFVGYLLAHPQHVLAQKIYCGRFTHPRQQHLGGILSLTIMQNLIKAKGPRALYAGFFPACLLYMIGYGNQIYKLSKNSLEYANR